MDGKGPSELPLGRRSKQADIKVRIGRSAIRPRKLWPLGADLLPHEDESRSVAVGYAEVGLAGGLEIAFAQKARGAAPEGTAPVS